MERNTASGIFSGSGTERFLRIALSEKTFEVPEHLAGKAGTLKLGTLVDSDRTYVNGNLWEKQGIVSHLVFIKFPKVY